VRGVLLAALDRVPPHRRHRLARLLLSAAALAVVAEVAYLAYANSLGREMIALPPEAPLEMTYERAYSLLPCHLDMARVRFFSHVAPGWSVSFENLVGWLCPNVMNDKWSGRITVPHQSVRVRSPVVTLGGEVEGHISLALARQPRPRMTVERGWLDIHNVLLKKELTWIAVRRATVAIYRADLRGRVAHANARISVHGNDMEQLLAAFGVANAVRWMMPPVSGLPWSLTTNLEVGTQGARLDNLRLESDGLVADGVAWSACSSLHAALVLKFDGGRVGLRWSEEGVRVVPSPSPAWPERISREGECDGRLGMTR
jgi:hypothetical protein